MEKETEVKANTIYRLIQEFKEESRRGSHTHSYYQRRHFNHHSPDEDRRSTRDAHDERDFMHDYTGVRNRFRDFNSIVIGRVEQNNNAYYINASEINLEPTQSRGWKKSSASSPSASSKENVDTTASSSSPSHKGKRTSSPHPQRK